MNKLNLGSGDDYRPGWINMDAYHPRADLKHNLLSFPWPILSSSITHIYASHVLEHIPIIMRDDRDIYLHLMEEMHRVLVTGGLLEVKVPLAGTHSDHSFFQHYRHFTPDSFHVFDPLKFPQSWYSRARFNIKKVEKESLGHCGAKWKQHVRDRLPFTRGLMEEKTGLRFELVKIPA